MFYQFYIKLLSFVWKKIDRGRGPRTGGFLRALRFPPPQNKKKNLDKLDKWEFRGRIKIERCKKAGRKKCEI
jgi:hypothetical protein